MSPRSTSEYARDLQEKFDFYVLGLLFTLLAAAVQTARFGRSPVADGAELLSWVLLLVSGLAGLSRMELQPIAHQNFGVAAERRRLVGQLEAEQAKGQVAVTFEDGQTIAITKAKQMFSEQAAARRDAGARLERSGLWKYQIQKICFGIGIATLMFSRAFVPAVGIYDAVREPAKVAALAHSVQEVTHLPSQTK